MLGFVRAVSGRSRDDRRTAPVDPNLPFMTSPAEVELPQKRAFARFFCA
jgi:hypothetical protein